MKSSGNTSKHQEQQLLDESNLFGNNNLSHAYDSHKANQYLKEDLSFYNPEGSNLRKAQMRMLNILDIFAGICEKHKIDYWLYAGTALGARRHNGFVPWDDDLDVAVRQKDFKKLMSVLEEELPSNLKLQTRKTDRNYHAFYAKIRDLNSVYHEDGSEKYKYKGIFVDIFFIEQVPSIFFKKVIDSILNSPYSYLVCKGFLRRLKYILFMFFLPVVNLTVVLSRMYYKNRETGILSYYYGWREYRVIKFSFFNPIVKMKFEGKYYNVPNHIDEYLAYLFGNDYMEIPPKNKRQVHAREIDIF